jgi:hypothetical protein
MHRVKLILINLVVFIVLLGGVEAYFRSTQTPSSPAAPNALELRIIPYVMFANFPRSHHPAWVNIFTNENVQSSIVSNNQGYNDRREFGPTSNYRKAVNERVVLLTGGSTIWGVGSTSTETTIAGRMEYYLNASQKNLQYSVVNLGMGSWIAYQQFIGLEFFGSGYDPDWVISMDGHNDAGVGCGYSQGARNPLYFPAMKAYIDAYQSSGQQAFHRGWLENKIIKHSATYRSLTKKNYFPDAPEIDRTNIDTTRGELRKIIIPTKLGDAREMLAFYLKAQEAMLKLFPKARYILSTQPMVNQFTGDFTNIYENIEDGQARRVAIETRARDVDRYLEVHAETWCNTQTYIPSFVYLYVKGAIELERLVERVRNQGKLVEYHNMGRLLPNERIDRMPYFIDAAHLSDKGADILGRFYAERILTADKYQEMRRTEQRQ